MATSGLARIALDELVERAKAADTLSVAQDLGARLKKVGANERAGSCPTCGGQDRFSINGRKGFWNCRKCGAGGDVIGLVRHVTGCSFAEAVEKITGQVRLGRSRDETHDEREERLRRNDKNIALARGQEEDQRCADEEKVRRDEQWIKDILERAIDLDDERAKHGKAYLTQTRGLTPRSGVIGAIKYVEAVDYYGCGDNGSGELKLLATLPAIAAVITDSGGKVIGVRLTYLDPVTPTKWKPIRSERNSPKKIRGEKKHGLIPWARQEMYGAW